MILTTIEKITISVPRFDKKSDEITGRPSIKIKIHMTCSWAHHAPKQYVHTEKKIKHVDKYAILQR